MSPFNFWKKKKIVPTFKLNKIDLPAFVFTSANNFFNPSIKPRNPRPAACSLPSSSYYLNKSSFHFQASPTPLCTRKEVRNIN